jgi:GDP-4-dehydro-6-deoxy-D-mannose reductase
VRVLVTGAGGFVGRWLVEELRAAGHELPGPPGERVEITDAAAVARVVREARPEGVVHLAALSFGPDAARDPDAAMLVNARGTRTLLDGLAGLDPAPAVVVVSSSDVYGAPDPADLPLSEDAPTRPTSAYGRSKLEAERVAFSAARESGLALAVVRPFNQTGPGQRAEFVAPALARRILAARDRGEREIVVGNVDVRRDLGDVRDLARALRLILDGLAGGSIPSGAILNVATGRSVAIRDVVAMIAEIAGVEIEPRVDPSLVRPDDPPEIRGDASRLTELTGWGPTIPLRRTLEDLVASLGLR